MNGVTTEHRYRRRRCTLDWAIYWIVYQISSSNCTINTLCSDPILLSISKPHTVPTSSLLFLIKLFPMFCGMKSLEIHDNYYQHIILCLHLHLPVYCSGSANFKNVAILRGIAWNLFLPMHWTVHFPRWKFRKKRLLLVFCGRKAAYLSTVVKNFPVMLNFRGPSFFDCGIVTLNTSPCFRMCSTLRSINSWDLHAPLTAIMQAT